MKRCNMMCQERGAEDVWVGGIAPHVINLGVIWRSVNSFTPRPLYPEKVPRYGLYRRLGGPQKQYVRGGEEKRIPTPAGNRAPVVHPAASVIDDPFLNHLNYKMLPNNINKSRFRPPSKHTASPLQSPVAA